MTPLAKAKALLTLVESAADTAEVELPSQRYAVLGEPVVDCESVIIALTGVGQPDEFNVHCGVPQLGTFSIIVARGCATMYDQEGKTIPSKADAVADAQSTDSEFLWSFANGYQEYLSKTWSLGYAITGGIAITSLLLTTGID